MLIPMLKSCLVKGYGMRLVSSVRLVVNKDELEGSYALAEIQVCQVKGVRVENISDKGISLYLFNAEELIEAQKQNGNLEYQRENLASGAVSSPEELFGCNPEVKCYHLERDCLLLDDSGVIWRQTGNPGDSERLGTSHTVG